MVLLTNAISNAVSCTSRLYNSEMRNCIVLEMKRSVPLDCSECFGNEWVLGSLCGQRCMNL